MKKVTRHQFGSGIKANMSAHTRFGPKDKVIPTDYITVKYASQLTGMKVNAIHQAIYAGKIKAVRAGQAGWGGDRRYHSEVSLVSLVEYTTQVSRKRDAG